MILREKFKTWPVDAFSNKTFITVNIYITNLDYLEDGLTHFTELLDGNIVDSSRMLISLDTTTVIFKIDNQDLPDLIDLKAEGINKKKKKTERCW